MKRKVIGIDEKKCNGCALCIPNCPEGAIRVIDGKARLVGDYLCDGLGACLGHCPQGAITIEERDAEPYDERKVMMNVVKQGMNVVKAHLEHLAAHGEEDKLGEAVALLKEMGLKNPIGRGKPVNSREQGHQHSGCPGMAARNFAASSGRDSVGSGERRSQLTHWPVQLHLMSPNAPHYRGRDVLLAADCVAFALGDFHKDYLKGKALAIACPKLDDRQDEYVEKIRALIDGGIESLTVMIMEVPCCRGLVNLVQEAMSGASRSVPIKVLVVGIRGDVESDAM